MTLGGGVTTVAQALDERLPQIHAGVHASKPQNVARLAPQDALACVEREAASLVDAHRQARDACVAAKETDGTGAPALYEEALAGVVWAKVHNYLMQGSVEQLDDLVERFDMALALQRLGTSRS